MKAGCIYVEAINEENALRKAKSGTVITVVKPVMLRNQQHVFDSKDK
jgi:hypothetical protein